MYDKILLATDGSEHSMKTVRKAVDLAEPLQAEVTILSVIEDVTLYKGLGDLSAEERESLYANMEKATKDDLEMTVQMFQDRGVEVKTMLRWGRPAEKICEAVEEGGFDLVVLGDSGYGGVKELLLGSVSNKVAHCAKTDVLIVKWMH